MTLQTLAAIAIRFDEQVLRFEPGAVFTVTDNQAHRLLERAPGKVRRITLPPDPVALSGPIPPLQPGWLVVYRDRSGTLCGGSDDRQHGTVQECRLDRNGWTLCLMDGQEMPLSIVRSVGQTDEAGQIVAAWAVKEHGYDGAGPVTREGQN